MERFPIRLLFFLREPFPTSRVDVDVLFGRKLSERGHRIDFVMQAADAAMPTGTQEWRGQTVRVGRTDTADGFVHRFRRHVLAFGHDLSNLLRARKTDYDAIQVRDKFLIAAVAVLVARSRKLKFFYWLSWPEPESQLLRVREKSARYPLLTYLRARSSAYLLYRWILPSSDHIFVQSQRMKDDVGRHGICAAKLTPVPMGVELADFSTIRRARSAAPTGECVVGYLGVLSSERKLGVLVDMLVELRKSGLSARLLLVGDAESDWERKAIQDHAAVLQVAPWVELTGFLPRAEALASIAAADVCVSPFYPTPILESTSPTKLIEYLALGIPVVANDHPEQRLVLSETRAGVCVPWGARHFARAVRWIMNRRPEEREAMGERGRAWVNTHRTYTQIADLVEQTYLQVLRPPLRVPAREGS